MKKIFYKTAVGILFATLALTGCVRETLSEFSEDVPAETRALKVTIGSSLSNNANAEKIQRVRFIAFDDISSSPKLDLNDYHDVSAEHNNKTVTQFSATLQLTENPNKFIIAIVNEPVGTLPDGSKTWRELLDDITQPSHLNDIVYTLAQGVNGQSNPLTSAANLSPSGLPMIGMLGLDLPGEDLEEEIDAAGTWSVPIMVHRILSRVDVYLKNNDNDRKASINASTKIEILNSSQKGYFVRDTFKYQSSKDIILGNWLTTSDSEYSKETNLNYVPSSSITIDNSNGTGNGQYVCSFYIPEWQYDANKPAADDKLGIRFTDVLNSGGGSCGGVFYLSEAVNESNVTKTLKGIERNNVYKLTGTVSPGLQEIQLGPIEISNWTPIDVEVDTLGRRLNVSDTDVTMLYRAKATADGHKIYFWTNQKKVYIEQKGYAGDDMGNQAGSTFVVNNVFKNLSGDTEGDGSTIDEDAADHFTFNPDNGSGCITLKPELTSGINVGRIVLNAGGLRKEILTTTVCTETPSRKPMDIGTPVYAGAFWRAAETGERLIRIPAAGSGDGLYTDEKGKWKAIVGHENGEQEWVLLDTKASADAYIWTPSVGDVVESSAAYQLIDGGKTTVSGKVTGDGAIYFRIGLKSKLDGGKSAAPRYGVVYLIYGNYKKLYKIYIRQGEAPDYLIHPDEISNSTQKNYVRKFGVYNLTAPGDELKNGDDWGAVSPRGGAFVKYPSQAGAMFQCAMNSPYERRAWHPATYRPSSGVWPGRTHYNPSPTWGAISDEHETCPTGYRRPTSDDRYGSGTTSEFLLSLCTNLEWERSADNSVWGYYADGFHDRRTITAAKKGYQAAHAGRLFYNAAVGPRTNASIFFPAAGIRTHTGDTHEDGNGVPGDLICEGGEGFYWSLSLTDETDEDSGEYRNEVNATACCLNFYSIAVYDGNIRTIRTCGMSVRCVVD